VLQAVCLLEADLIAGNPRRPTRTGPTAPRPVPAAGRPAAL